MPHFGQLNQLHRRSSSFTVPQTFESFMEYAAQCRDELEIYFYMEENNIGISDPKFWLAMLDVLRQKCQFKLIIRKLSEIKKLAAIKEHDDFYKFQDFQDNLARQLQITIRKRRGKKRRSVKEFQLFSISRIQKKKRKVGGIEIYVDEDCRDNYKLQDYSDFFLENMQEEVQARKLQYERKQSVKDPSFLAINKKNMEKWTLQLIELKRRNSQLNIASEHKIAPLLDQQSHTTKRFSISRKSNLMPTINPQNIYKTPKQHQRKESEKKGKIPSSKQNYVFTTPKSQSIHFQRQLLKSYRKPQIYGRKGNYQNSLSDQDEVSKLEDQICGLQKDDNLQIDGFECPDYKELIRRDPGKVDGFQQQFCQIRDIATDWGKDAYSKQNSLDVCKLQISGILERKMQIQQDFDKQLEHTIQIIQIQSLETKKSFLKIETTSFNESPSSTLTQIYQSDSSSQVIQPSIINCIKSTQTLQSIDSNQQNVISAKKSKQTLQYAHAFRKDRKVFQVLCEQDLGYVSNDDSSSFNDMQILPNKNPETMSIQGNQFVQQLIDSIDRHSDSSRVTQTNLVLQTMRKKKLTQMMSHRIEKQNPHENGTFSELKTITRPLSYISEESSYNSERKYKSKQRHSSGFYRDFDAQFP